MSVFGWLRGRRSGSGRPRDEWRRAWEQAVEVEDVSQLGPLKERLEPLNAPGDDVEVELEMLDGLEQLKGLLDATSLPVVETQHRVVAGDVCHFTAPASLPDDPGQASGRVLFTGTKSIFVGGALTQPIPWHSVRYVGRSGRDVSLGRHDETVAAHFRFNTYGDAVVATYLARRLSVLRSKRVL